MKNNKQIAVKLLKTARKLIRMAEEEASLLHRLKRFGSEVSAVVSHVVQSFEPFQQKNFIRYIG